MNTKEMNTTGHEGYCCCCYQYFPVTELRHTLGADNQTATVCEPCRQQYEYEFCDACQAYHYQGDCPREEDLELMAAEPACECRRVDVDVDDPRDCELHNGAYAALMEATLAAMREPPRIAMAGNGRIMPMPSPGRDDRHPAVSEGQLTCPPFAFPPINPSRCACS